MKTRTLDEKIAHYLATLAVWDATEDHDECLSIDGPEFDAHVMAEHAMVTHACTSNEEVKRKVEFLVSHEYLFETIQGKGTLMMAFMRSLVIPSENGPQRRQGVGTRAKGCSLPQEAAAMGEAFAPHQNGEDG